MVHNGASYYFQYFSKRYDAKLNQRANVQGAALVQAGRGSVNATSDGCDGNKSGGTGTQTGPEEETVRRSSKKE